MNSQTLSPAFLRITLPFTVRAYDIDAMGIVSNIVYVRWFEDLRTAFLETYHPLRDMFAEGVTPILVHTDVHYRSPVTINDQPTGESWVDSMGNSKWQMGFAIRVGDRVCCTGTQEGLFIDLKRRKPTGVPRRLADAFARETNAGNPGS